MGKDVLYNRKGLRKRYICEQSFHTKTDEDDRGSCFQRDIVHLSKTRSIDSDVQNTITPQVVKHSVRCFLKNISPAFLFDQLLSAVNFPAYKRRF